MGVLEEAGLVFFELLHVLISFPRQADATVFAAETSQPPETMSKDATQMDAEETAAQKDAEAGDEEKKNEHHGNGRSM